MTLEELDQRSKEQLQTLYNSEYNVNRRKAETAYRDICSEINEKKQIIDDCIKNLDYDNAVCHEENLAKLEARQETMKRVLDNFSSEPVYHHEDIVKICEVIDSEKKKYIQEQNQKLYHQIENVLASIEDIEAMRLEYEDMTTEYYKNSPRYDGMFSNPYRIGSGNYTYVKEHIENALQSLKPYLK